jgi:S-adenosylmethionine:tRNA ribosyltransferase-isomerase
MQARMNALMLLPTVLKGEPLSLFPDFELPPELEAAEPPEARGLERDQVRLLVSRVAQGRIEHALFRQVPDFLEPGDALVINTSATLAAALRAWRKDGTELEVHLSTRLPAKLWSLEVRQRGERASQPFFGAVAGERLDLPGGGQARLYAPYGEGKARLWVAGLQLPLPLEEYLERHGFPIRYEYVKQDWPLEYYQTAYATEPGSAEMPSAGRPFTAQLITRLVAKGVEVVPLVLHAGVSSLEEGEPPWEEYYRVPEGSARRINAARQAGGRIIAVGTTVGRALETVADSRGAVHPGEGWTWLVIGGKRALRAVDGLLTGLHEPRASHLAMLRALAGEEHLRRAYAEALRQGYLWHEFGDGHLILP